MDCQQNLLSLLLIYTSLLNISSRNIQPNVHSVLPSLTNNFEESNILSDKFLVMIEILDNIGNKLDNLGDKFVTFKLDLTELRNAKLNLHFVKEDIYYGNLCETFEMKFNNELETIAGLLQFIISNEGNNHLHDITLNLYINTCYFNSI